MISIQLIFASHKRDKSKFPKIEFDLTDTTKSNIIDFRINNGTFRSFML